VFQALQLRITQEQCQQLLAMLTSHNSENSHASTHQVGSIPANQNKLFSNMSSNFLVSLEYFI
jgi:hypothetical protein